MMTPPVTLPSVTPEQFTSRSYDYIVVGGGTAGLVVAARLSERPDVCVGVIEAGEASWDTLAINVPGRYGESLGSHQDWQYETTPQPGLGGRKLPWPRGKVLGGTSALNFMAWTRPNAEDLDAWETLGNKGWGWKDVAPFYRKSEHFTEPTPEDSKQHSLIFDREALGTDGPLPVTYLKEYSMSHQYWHKTLNSLGVETNERHLSGSNVGCWTNIVAVDAKTVTRAYSATAYYLPNAERKNLVLLTGAFAREIVLQQQAEKWVAKGVRFEHGGKHFTAEATTEVVISGGSIASPQLLELSGIGDPAVLKAAGISVKVPNPNVGSNVQDHMMLAHIFEVDPSISAPEDLRSDAVLAAAADKLYETSQGGPRTMVPASFCYLPLSHFIPTERMTTLADRAAGSTPKARILSRRLADAQRLGYIEYIFDIGNWSPFYPAEEGKKYGTLLQILQYPFSLGSIHISPKDPTGIPHIDPEYYGGENGPLDLEIQTLCAEFGQKLVHSQPLAQLITKSVSPPADAKEDVLKQWVVDNTVTDWHPVGTCGMGGHEGIKGGVVDERLKVYGVKSLRVVDASIMPLQISAHLQATVYAIAEKASVMMLEDRDAAGKATNGMKDATGT